MTAIIAMIPARMGSQRLAKKNLRELDGVSLIARAIRRCHSAGCFDEVWVNSEHADFGPIAEAEGATLSPAPRTPRKRHRYERRLCRGVSQRP